jgi:hypothetical protein
VRRAVLTASRINFRSDAPETCETTVPLLPGTMKRVHEIVTAISPPFVIHTKQGGLYSKEASIATHSRPAAGMRRRSRRSMQKSHHPARGGYWDPRQ